MRKSTITRRERQTANDYIFEGPYDGREVISKKKVSVIEMFRI